jgi:hypothetical protein
VERWLAHRSSREALGAGTPERSASHRALRRELAALVERAPLANRAALGARVQGALDALERARTSRTDREIRASWRSGLRELALLESVERAAQSWLPRKHDEPRGPARLVALLLFQPDRASV